MGAAGKSAGMVVSELTKRGAKVRGFVRSSDEIDAVKAVGADGVIPRKSPSSYADGLVEVVDQEERGETNYDDGGRGVYFPDPDGHLLELITQPYGGLGGGRPVGAP